MNEILNRIVSWIISALLALGIVPSSRVEYNTKIISDNITTGLLCGDLGPYMSSSIRDKDEILSLVSENTDEGSYFTYIDYSVNTSGSWRPRIHIERLYFLTECCVTETDPAEKTRLESVISSLMDYWLKKDYQSVNWWYNEIAVPNLIGQTAILGKDIFSDEQMKGIKEQVGRGCLTVNSDTRDQTGTNASDVAVSSIYYAVLTNSGRALRKAVDTLSSELKYSGNEGLKRDYTFFQHGKRLYIGGYGISFIENYAKVLYILNGSDYSFTEKQLEPLSLYIVNGVRRMSFGNSLDPTVQGRVISRSGNSPLESLESSLRLLVRIDNVPYKESIKEFADSIAENKKSDIGLHYFEDAAFLVINNSDFYFSFRGGKKNLYYAETLNNENILSYNSSFPGVTTIMGKGGEYRDIPPVMDFSMVPGTTAVYETDEQLAGHTDYNKRTLPGKYYSFAEDGTAISAAHTTHEEINMTVACFATDNAAVLLGAGMTDNSGKPMNTTVNQCIYDGEYTQNGNTIIHSGVKYKIIDGENFKVSVEEKTGSYRRNNLPDSNTEVTKQVFTLYFPCDGSYSYSVMGENTDVDFRVIVNTEKIQAVVMPDGRIAAVFYSPGSFEYDGEIYRSIIPSAILFD